MPENVISAEKLEERLTANPFNAWMGLRILKLTDDEIEIGMPVAVTFAEINDSVTLPLFQRVRHEREGPRDG